MMTGRVQEYNGPRKTNLTIGEPFAYKNAKGEWISLSGVKLKSYKVKFKTSNPKNVKQTLFSKIKKFLFRL